MQKNRSPASQTPARPRRLTWLDRQRGVAVGLMVIYHFCFDLDQYGYIRQEFNTDVRWLTFRALIVCLFMSALGASVALAYPARIDAAKLLARQLRLGLACIAVTLASAWMFPASFIWFGILHFAWVATLLALPLRGLGWPLLPLALLVACLGNSAGAAFFDTPWLGWIGYMTHKPVTEDYVPLLPWFAAVLLGLYAAPFLARAGRARAGFAPAGQAQADHERAGQGPARQRGALAPLERFDRALRWTGSHTLIIYLLHQPILLGLLEAVQRTHAAA